MTASTVKSAAITGFETVPVTLSDAKQGGRVRVWIETKEIATTSIDEADDIIKMLRVPANMVPISLHVYNDDLDSHATPTLAADVGMFRADSGAVIDADGFASAITTLQAANTSGVNVIAEAHDIADIGKTMWQLAGMSADPGVMIDVGFTVTTQAATAAAGTITMVLIGAMK